MEYTLNEQSQLGKKLAGIEERTVCGIPVLFRKDDFSDAIEIFSVSNTKDITKLAEVLQYSQKHLGVTKILRATTQDVERVSQIGAYRSVNIGEEFIYLTKELGELPGSKFKKIRQAVHKLAPLIEIKPYSHALEQPCTHFLASLKSEKFSEEELKLNQKALALINGKTIRGLVLFHEKTVVGLAIYTLEKKLDTIFGVCLKTEKTPRDLAEFTLHILTQKHEDYRYFNSGNFGKRPGLKQFKEKLKPFAVNEVFKIFLS